MLDQITSLIAIIFASAASALYYKKTMTGGSRNQRFIDKAKKHGNYTAGTYVDLEVLTGDLDSKDYSMRNKELRVRYQYKVNGVTYYKFLHFQNIGRVKIDFPIEVTVYYDPNNPKKACCPEEASKYQQKQAGCLGAIAIWIVIAAILINLLKFLLG